MEGGPIRGLFGAMVSVGRGLSHNFALQSFEKSVVEDL